MLDEPFSPEEIARQLDETRTGATLSVGPLGDWLRKKKLVRKNPRTGWFDTTVRAAVACLHSAVEVTRPTRNGTS